MKSWVVPSGKGRNGHRASLSKYKVKVVTKKVDPDCQCASIRFVDTIGSLAEEKAGQAAGSQSRQTIPHDPIIRDQIYKLTR
jgi:hypothetical protein